MNMKVFLQGGGVTRDIPAFAVTILKEDRDRGRSSPV